MEHQKVTRLILMLLPILLLAMVLRFWNLNSLPIFADEAIYVRWAQVMKAESSLRFLPLSDGKQPLYMWAMIPLFKIIQDPLIAGRLLSGLMGLGTVVGVGVASFLLFKNVRQALMTSAIAATIPYLVFFDRMALADSMLACFMIWTFVLSYLSFEHRRLDMAMLAGFTLGFAWLTKSPAIFAFILLPLNFLITKFDKRNVLNLLATFAIAFGMYNILRLGPEFHMIALRNQDYVFSWQEVLRHPRDPLIPHLKDSWQFYLYFATPIGLLLAIWGLWGAPLLLVAWTLAPVFAQSFIAKQFTARYLLFTVPFAVMLIGHAIEHIGQRTQKHFLFWMAGGLTVLILGGASWQLISKPESYPLPQIERRGYLEEWTAGFGIKQVAEQIKSLAKDKSVVVGSEGFFGTPFSALELYLNKVPNVRVVGVGVVVDKVPEKLQSATKDNLVYLVFNSERFHIIDPEKSGLKLLGSYPKSIKSDGTRNYLLFFEVLKI